MSTKAIEAAKEQSKERNEPFDESKMVRLHEEDPILAGRNGVISVQVYQYDDGEPRIGVYRVGFSQKSGKPWQRRDLPSLTINMAHRLADCLRSAAQKLKEIEDANAQAAKGRGGKNAKR